MSHVRTTVRTLDSHSAENELTLPRKLCRQLQIHPSTVTVHFGSMQASGHLRESNSVSSAVLSSSLASSLRIPSDSLLSVSYNPSSRSLRFGPLVGVLVSRYALFPQNPFGTFTPFLNEITEICRRRGGIAVALRPEDVNWENGTVRGLVRKNGAWRQITLPLPQCIYNRLGNRKAEKSAQVNQWIEKCKEREIPFFNERFLNKWHVHQALQQEADAAAYLPQTVRYLAHQNLEHMLRTHRVVYAKPTNGSMGQGIFLLRATSDGYALVRPAASGSVTQKFQQVSSLHKALQKRISGKPYLLQQGLSLIGLNGKPADFRVLAQKDRLGQWSVSSLVARLGRNKVVSNIARGGSMTTAAQALRICGPKLSGPVGVPALKQAALRLAQLLDQSIEGHYAEFGIDLGVDVHGRIWLLEVNSKPSKSTSAVKQSDTEEGAQPPPRRPRPSVIRMLDYASYLSGFPLPGQEKKPRMLRSKKRVTQKKRKRR